MPCQRLIAHSHNDAATTCSHFAAKTKVASHIMPFISKSSGLLKNQQRDRRSNDPKYEGLINEAMECVMSGEFQSFRQASKELQVHDEYLQAISNI